MFVWENGIEHPSPDDMLTNLKKVDPWLRVINWTSCG